MCILICEKLLNNDATDKNQGYISIKSSSLINSSFIHSFINAKYKNNVYSYYLLILLNNIVQLKVSKLFSVVNHKIFSNIIDPQTQMTDIYTIASKAMMTASKLIQATQLKSFAD